MDEKVKRSCSNRVTTFYPNLLTLQLKQATIKIQRGATVVDGLPLRSFSYKKATVVSQAGGCFFLYRKEVSYAFRNPFLSNFKR